MKYRKWRWKYIKISPISSHLHTHKSHFTALIINYILNDIPKSATQIRSTLTIHLVTLSGKGQTTKHSNLIVRHLQINDNSQLREPLNQALSRNVKCFFLLRAIQVAPQIWALLLQSSLTPSLPPASLTLE